MVRATPFIPPPQDEIVLGDGRSVHLEAQIGRGSMATVYRGIYAGPFGIKRCVAVKVFDVIASDEHDSVLSALATVARRAAFVRHPNVARIEDFGLVAPAQPYAISELVEGRSLTRLLARTADEHERLRLDVALFIGIEVAEGLAGARLATSEDGVRLGIMHGELSSSDVLLSWHGEVKLSDFGVATAARAASSVRSMRGFARRLQATAPEVARGAYPDARSDVFSLGVLLRELLVGPRFPEKTTDAQALAWARDGVVLSSVFERHVPQQLGDILERALERDPEKRYPHAAALGYELRRVALAMGVGDGRTFLRKAMARAFAADGEDDFELTHEFQLPKSVLVDITDRFARLRDPRAELEGGGEDEDQGPETRREPHSVPAPPDCDDDEGLGGT
jgi:serine/threonine-protein kinase